MYLIISMVPSQIFLITSLFFDGNYDGDVDIMNCFFTECEPIV